VSLRIACFFVQANLLLDEHLHNKDNVNAFWFSRTITIFFYCYSTANNY